MSCGHPPLTVHGRSGYGSLNGVSVKDARGLTVAVAIGDVPELKPVELARLIAAAPELLAELQVAVLHLETLHSLSAPEGTGRGLLWARIKAARAAIAKATTGAA